MKKGIETVPEGGSVDEGSTYQAHTILSATFNILFMCAFLLYFGGIDGWPIFFIGVSLAYLSEKSMKTVEVSTDSKTHKIVKYIERTIDVLRVFLALILLKIIFFEVSDFFRGMPDFIVLCVVFITMEFLRMYIGVIVRRKPDVVEL